MLLSVMIVLEGLFYVVLPEKNKGSVEIGGSPNQEGSNLDNTVGRALRHRVWNLWD